MLVGHFAVAFVAKRVEPAISLGTGVLASMLADVLGSIFLLAGIEHVQFKPGFGAANYFVASDISLSHSLLMDALWAALLAGVFFLRRHFRRAAWILFACVLSHWILDVISHRPDMPLAPGLHRYFGLGLWTSIPATVILEGGFWLFAIIFYLRATHPEKRSGVYVFWIGVAVLTLAWYNNVTGVPPQSARAAGVQSLIFFSDFVAWAYWMNRLRPALPTADSTRRIHD